MQLTNTQQSDLMRSGQPAQQQKDATKDIHAQQQHHTLGLQHTCVSSVPTRRSVSFLQAMVCLPLLYYVIKQLLTNQYLGQVA